MITPYVTIPFKYLEDAYFILKGILQVVIIKMKESSGNEQFFVQLRHKTCESSLDINKILNHGCHQTIVQRTVVRTVEQCLERAWFDASMLSKFIFSTKEDVKILGLSEDEMNYMKQQIWLDA